MCIDNLDHMFFVTANDITFVAYMKRVYEEKSFIRAFNLSNITESFLKV